MQGFAQCLASATPHTGVDSPPSHPPPPRMSSKTLKLPAKPARPEPEPGAPKRRPIRGGKPLPRSASRKPAPAPAPAADREKPARPAKAASAAAAKPRRTTEPYARDTRKGERSSEPAGSRRPRPDGGPRRPPAAAGTVPRGKAEAPARPARSGQTSPDAGKQSDDRRRAGFKSSDFKPRSPRTAEEPGSDRSRPRPTRTGAAPAPRGRPVAPGAAKARPSPVRSGVEPGPPSPKRATGFHGRTSHRRVLRDRGRHPPGSRQPNQPRRPRWRNRAPHPNCRACPS